MSKPSRHSPPYFSSPPIPRVFTSVAWPSGSPHACLSRMSLPSLPGYVCFHAQRGVHAQLGHVWPIQLIVCRILHDNRSYRVGNRPNLAFMNESSQSLIVDIAIEAALLSVGGAFVCYGFDNRHHLILTLEIFSSPPLPFHHPYPSSLEAIHFPLASSFPTWFWFFVCLLKNLKFEFHTFCLSNGMS